MAEADEDELESQALDLLLIEKLALEPQERKASDADKYKAIISLNSLVLDRQRIGSISGLDTLSNLVHLSLCHNRLRSIHGLERLAELEVLSLAGNKITKIQGISSLQKLRTLDLADNSVTELPEGHIFPAGLSSLQLNGNPVAAGSGYRMSIVSACPTLIELDCALVTSVERVAANRAANAVKAPQDKKRLVVLASGAGSEAPSDVYDDAMSFAHTQMQVQQEGCLARVKARVSKAREEAKVRRDELEDAIQETVQVRSEMESTIERFKLPVKPVAKPVETAVTDQQTYSQPSPPDKARSRSNGRKSE